MTLTLIFKLEYLTYGLEIDMIQEIIEDPVLYYTPKADGVLKGTINFHGQILAVIDLPELLGVKNSYRDHRHLVLSSEGKSMVLQVSSVDKIVPLELSFLEPPTTEEEEKAIRGIAEFDEQPVNMLDTNKIIKQLEMTFAE